LTISNHEKIFLQNLMLQLGSVIPGFSAMIVNRRKGPDNPSALKGSLKLWKQKKPMT